MCSHRIDTVSHAKNDEMDAVAKIPRVSFPTLGDALGYLRKAIPDPGAYWTSNSCGEDWSRGENLVGAMSLAVKGWPAVITAAAKARNLRLSSAPHYERAMVNDVVGSRVNISRYLSGNPNCLRRRAAAPKRPLIRLICSQCPSGAISADELMTRGVGIIAAVNALEKAQFVVEIVTTWKTDNGECAITVKQAGKPISAPRVAYALAHSAFSRQILLAAGTKALADARRLPEHLRERPGIHGMPLTSPAERPGDVVIPCAALAAHDSTTAAADAALDAIRAAGIEV